MLKKIKLKIKGLYCQSCKILIESELESLSGINKVEVDLKNDQAEIEYNEELISAEKIVKIISDLDYTVKVDNGSIDVKEQANKKQPSFLLGLLIPLVLVIMIAGYFIISSFGGFEILANLNESNVGFGLVFFIGLIASFHCIGMCGGLVVAYSSANLKEDQPKTLLPHWQYNAGRLISYTIMGGLLGGIGSFFAINPIFTGVMILFAGIFMVLMGLSFIFNWAILKKIKINTPQFIGRYIFKQKQSKNPKAPLLIGLLTAFMPCGPLQAMQLYALASGDIIRGGLSMAFYALGTVPLMFGFGAFLSFISKQHIKKILKFSGVLVAVLGLIMINRSLISFGITFNGSARADNQLGAIFDPAVSQIVNMELSYLGYNPKVLYINKTQPVRWVINVKEMSGCTNSIMIEDLNIKQDLHLGENIIEFIPPKNVKELKFSCWMRMVWGKFILQDDNNIPSQDKIDVQAKALPQGSCEMGGDGGGCGCES